MNLKCTCRILEIFNFHTCQYLGQVAKKVQYFYFVGDNCMISDM